MEQLEIFEFISFFILFISMVFTCCLASDSLNLTRKTNETLIEATQRIEEMTEMLDRIVDYYEETRVKEEQDFKMAVNTAITDLKNVDSVSE